MLTILLLVPVFVVLLLINVPISVSIALATLAAMLLSIDFGPAVTTIAQRMVGGINSFTLLAIPFFILSGQIMGRGGIARRLIAAARAILGRIPGGLAFVNVLSSMLFGAISGSAVATTSAIGSFMVPEMNKAGYGKGFSGAVSSAGSITGLLIPPSNTLIVYAVASGGVSIAALFMAGYLPGIVLGLMLMLACSLHVVRHGLPRGAVMPPGEAVKCIWQAVPGLFMIVIIIGGILGGVFTPTEAGAVAIVYALVLALLYREITLKDLPELLLKSAETTAVVMLLIGASSALGWLLTYENIPAAVSQTMLTISDNPLLILLLMNLILLLVGAFLDLTPAVLIFTPIFMPVALELGISPVHFGIMLITNLSIGLCTPPVGSLLFVGCAVAKAGITDLVKPMLPLYLAMLLTLLAVIFIPELSEWLPRQFGLL